MKKKSLLVLNCAMAFIATLVGGVIASFKFLHLNPLAQVMLGGGNGTTTEVVDSLNMYCFSFFGINGFVMFIALCSAMSSAINRKSCYLVLMIFVFLTAIVLLIILGLTVGMTFNRDGALGQAQSPIDQMLTLQTEQLMIIFISHIGVHLVLLITTGIVTTVIYCQVDSERNSDPGSTKVSVLHKTNLNKMYFDGRRHLTSQSFHYEGFHEQQQHQQQNQRLMVLNGSRDHLDAVQERKLPTLPNSNFQLIQTSKLDPASFRSAPNLNRLHSNNLSTNPYASPLNVPDESTSGESGEHTEKSPLIKLRPESTVNHNYTRRKLCASLTEEEILRPDNGDLSRSPQRARKSPIRSLHEADEFVSSLSNVKPPKVPPRPHERQKSTGSSFNVSFNLDHERKDDDIYEPTTTKQQLATARLITVPEPSEADEDSMGYTKIKEESETKIGGEVEDQVCHV